MTQDAARFDRTDSWSFATTMALVLAIYLFTMPPNLTLVWSGIFSTGAMYSGVPFTGGYPVWTIYSWPFIHLLPFSNIAWRVGVGSAVAAAVACGLITLMVSRSGKIILGDMPAFARLRTSEQNLLRGVCGCVAGLVFGSSRAVWSEAIVGEFWALGFLLFASVLCLFTRWFFEPAQKRRLYAALFLCGLLLTNNQELLVPLPGLICGVMLADGKLGRDVALLVLPLAAVATGGNQWSVWIDFPTKPNWPMLAAFLATMLMGAALALKSRRIGSEWKAAILSGLFLVLGLSFYLYVPIASMTNPPVNWGYPRTVEGFLHTISRGQFEKIRPTDDVGLFANQLWWFTRATGREFGWLYLVPASLPFCFICSLNRVGRNWLLGLLAMFLCAGPFLMATMNPPLDAQAMDFLKPCFAAPFVVLAMCLGLGLTLVGAVLTRPSAASVP